MGHYAAEMGYGQERENDGKHICPYCHERKYDGVLCVTKFGTQWVCSDCFDRGDLDQRNMFDNIKIRR